MMSWTEYDLVRAEGHMFEQKIYQDAMRDEALGTVSRKRRPVRTALIWTLTTLASLLAVEHQPAPQAGKQVFDGSGVSAG
ncbi:MAG TPA: hypothetical protein VKU87_10590 [Thermomicrobiaceae bacterium]|nr:hypothetical protein [Thermomicrobiaceae bacterium]